jgi:hypothetical protein
MSPSARTSKGFLFVATRFRWPEVRFKQPASRICRLTVLFERSQQSAASCVQSKRETAISPRAGSTWPSSSNASFALADFPFQFVGLGLVKLFLHRPCEVCVEQSILHRRIAPRGRNLPAEPTDSRAITSAEAIWKVKTQTCLSFCRRAGEYASVGRIDPADQGYERKVAVISDSRILWGTDRRTCSVNFSGGGPSSGENPGTEPIS